MCLKKDKGQVKGWRRLFACVGRRVRSEAVHTGQWEKPGQGVGEKNEEGNLSDGAKEEVVEKELCKEVTFNRMSPTISEDAGTIYTNPACVSSCELDTIDDTSFVPVWDSSSIVEVQCIDTGSWYKQPVLETGDESSHSPTIQDTFDPFNRDQVDLSLTNIAPHFVVTNERN